VLALLAPVAALTLLLVGDDEELAPGTSAAIERAEAHESADEWEDASLAWSEAFDRTPTNPEFAAHAGIAAWRNEDCPKAKRVLDMATSDEALKGKVRRNAEEILVEIEGQECATLDEEAAMERARGIYQRAEELAASEPNRAAYLYEDAYYLVPGKHGFAFKVGTTAFEAKICSKAQQYLSHFTTYGDPEKHAEMLTEADKLMNRLETMGCGDEAPPPVENTRGCSVAGAEDGGAAALGLLGVMALTAQRRRRRSQTEST
jgi:MYXO-CTERM domain-containing protein